MPTYEFSCSSCKRSFDARFTIAEYDAGLDPACPHCGNKGSEQKVSQFFAVSKGGASGAGHAGPCSGCCGTNPPPSCPKL